MWGDGGGEGGGGYYSGGGGGYSGDGEQFFSRWVMYEGGWVWQLLCGLSLVHAAHFVVLGGCLSIKKSGTEADV